MSIGPEPLNPAGNDTYVIAFSGALNFASVPALRARIFHDIQAAHYRQLAVDGRGLTQIDGAGLGFLAELQQFALQRGWKDLVISGCPAELERLIAMSIKPSATAPELARPREGFVICLGDATLAIWKYLADLVRFLGDMLIALGVVIRTPRYFRWGEFLDMAQEVGANALPILGLLGFLLGAILAFQTSVPLNRFGAVELVPTIVGIAILRELGPLITAILVAGRSGSAFAAEIGTMRVTEELSALRVMGLNISAFLMIPRVLAAVLTMPLLCIYTDVMGIVGGFTVMGSRGYSFPQYLTALRSGIEIGDAVGGVAKTIVFAALIAFAGCQSGLSTGAGPGAVGQSTTRAVVASIVLIIAADVIFGFVFYALGI